MVVGAAKNKNPRLWDNKRQRFGKEIEAVELMFIATLNRFFVFIDHLGLGAVMIKNYS